MLHTSLGRWLPYFPPLIPLAGVTLTIRQPGVELTPEEQEERREIYDALDRCGGNQTRAAKQLGMSRAALAAKLAGYRRPPTSPR